jgi:hypothetical protein
MTYTNHRWRVLDFISENWGIIFILYGFIIFITAILSYVGLIKIPVIQLTLYMSISLAIGITLQLLSSLAIIRKSAYMHKSILNRLLNTNIGVFFYAYSVLLLWCSVYSYVINDYVQHFTLLQYGGVSALVGIILHIISKALSMGKRSQVPSILVLMIASLSSIFLFYNFILPMKLSNLLKVSFALGYLVSIPVSYFLSLNILKNVASGIFTALLVMLTPLVKPIVKSGDISLLIFSVTYLLLILLMFYLGRHDIAIGLSAITVAVQTSSSKAFPLTILLVFIGIVIERIKSNYKKYVTYSALTIALFTLVYLLFFRFDLVIGAFKIFNIYLTVTLALSACISIFSLLNNDPANSSRISAAFIPLIIGLLTYFKESTAALIYLALILASLSITYLFESFSINRTGDEEVEITIELEKLLLSAPIIALFLLSLIDWL